MPREHTILPQGSCGSMLLRSVSKTTKIQHSFTMHKTLQSVIINELKISFCGSYSTVFRVCWIQPSIKPQMDGRWAPLDSSKIMTKQCLVLLTMLLIWKKPVHPWEDLQVNNEKWPVSPRLSLQQPSRHLQYQTRRRTVTSYSSSTRQSSDLGHATYTVLLSTNKQRVQSNLYVSKLHLSELYVHT
jgi:hypothetical protein